MASEAEAAGDTSTSGPEAREKPVVVRVKRKPSQTRPDAFCEHSSTRLLPPLLLSFFRLFLFSKGISFRQKVIFFCDLLGLEINERPTKKAMLDFSSLSITESSSSSAKAPEEPRVKKLLVQHIETVHHSEAVEDVLHSLLSDSGAKERRSKTKEWNDRIKQDKKQDQLRTAARQRHEDLGKNARFAQIWSSRKGGKTETDETLRELCHLYDAVQVDSDGEKHPAEPLITSFEEGAILCNFLPLLREHLPSAAEEIESDIISLAQSEDSDVYDIYTVKEVDDTNMEDISAASYPLLQVDDGDCYNDDEYPYDTDDSNAENNPLYDYPEEESSGEEDDDSEDPFADGSGSEYEKEEVELDE